MGAFSSSNVFVDGATRMVIMNGEMIPFHPKMSGRNITTINGKCYIDRLRHENTGEIVEKSKEEIL